MKRFGLAVLLAELAMFVSISGKLWHDSVRKTEATKPYRIKEQDRVLLYSSRDIFASSLDSIVGKDLAKDSFTNRKTGGQDSTLQTSLTWERTVEAARQLLDAEKRGQVVVVSRGSHAVVLKREQFTSSVVAPVHVEGALVRLTDSARKGFVGWTRADELEDSGKAATPQQAAY